MSEPQVSLPCNTPLLKTFVSQRPVLVKAATRIVGCPSRAEDVVQDAYFRLETAPQITSSLKAQIGYLFQVVRNLAIDHYRKRSVESKYTSPQDDHEEVATVASPGPENTYIGQRTLNHLDAALAELPQRTRYAFEMYRIHGVAQKDIAKELGVSPTLVNFMIRDALAHCHQSLKEFA
ncbi:pyoverdine signaling pathway sigma factor PvdS [Pseudomonas sp. No.117]